MSIDIDTPEAEAELHARLEKLTLEEKTALVSGAGFWTTTAVPGIGLRSLALSDGPAGIRGAEYSERSPSAALPNATCLAASFDTSLAERAGALIGAEARRHGVDVVLGPTVNLHRSPRGGRNFEAFSEDAQLTADIASGLVDGIQSQGVAATAKHYIGNDAETERMTADSVIDERTLRRVYMVPFEQLVRENGIQAVMSSYNHINGITGTESPLLEDPLRTEWGFDGLVVSDWDAVRSVNGAEAGTDLAMPGPNTVWNRGLAQAVRDGAVSVAALDRKVLALLRTAARVGALEGFAPRVDRAALASPEEPTAPAVRELLTEIATAGAVLLRNENGMLPLDADVASIAVIGPAATRPRIGGGGSATVVPPHTVTPLDGVRAAFPHARITVALGADPHVLLEPLGDRSTAADGEPGYDVVFLDADGGTLGTDRRRGGDLIYGMGYPAGIDGSTVARIRVSGRLTPAGPHRIALAGAGHATLRLAGETIADERLDSGGRDVIACLSHPPQLVVERELDGGEEFVIEFAPEPESLHALRIGLAGPARTAEDLRAEAVTAARDADVAVVCVGTTETDESEGFDRSSIALDPAQDALVAAVAAVNPRTVVVLNVGAPIALPWREETAAILLAHFPGQEGGEALGRILSGVSEPGGRLPTTWPAGTGSPVPATEPVDGRLEYAEGEAFGYRDPDADTAYGFGHGLGYTTWQLVAQTVEPTADGGLSAEARLRNTGARRGRQTVLLFADGGSAEPSRRFVGAASGEAEAGEETTVRFIVGPERLRRLLGADARAGASGELRFSAADTADADGGR